MEKKICPNGHEYDPAVNGFCPVCGQAAQTDSMASIFDGFGDDEGSAPAAAAQPDSAPFMTMYGSFDDYDNSTPPPIRTIAGGGDSDPLPQAAPPPVRSMKPIPGQPAVNPVQPQAQPRPGFPNNAPQAVPLNNLNQQGAYMNGRPQMMPGQAPMQAQPQGQPMQPQAIPQYRRAQSLHNQPGTYANRPQAYGVPLRNAQAPQTTPPPFGVPINTAPAHQQVPPFGVPLQGQTQSQQLRTDAGMPQMQQQFRMPQFGQQFGQPVQNADMQMNFEPAGYTQNMSMGDFAPQPQPRQDIGDGDVTVAMTNTPAEAALPVGCLLVLGGNAKGEMYTVRAGDNILGRSGKGVTFPIDLRFNKKIHRAPQAVVSYDVKNRRYTISPAVGAMNAIYLNGSKEPLTGTVELNSYDKILVEGTVMLFVGFCGSIFVWDNVL